MSFAGQGLNNLSTNAFSGAMIGVVCEHAEACASSADPPACLSVSWQVKGWQDRRPLADDRRWFVTMTLFEPSETGSSGDDHYSFEYRPDVGCGGRHAGAGGVCQKSCWHPVALLHSLSGYRRGDLFAYSLGWLYERLVHVWHRRHGARLFATRILYHHRLFGQL